MSFSNRSALRTLMAGSAIASSLFITGCLSSPTYGTDKTASAQLLDDVSNITKLTPERKASIAYAPRPELVRPADARNTALPAPQESVVAANGEAWPESPEQRRARLRAESRERNEPPLNRGSSTVTPSSEMISEIETVSIDAPKVGQSPRFRPGTEQGNNKARQAEIKRRLVENNQGSTTNRKYLSEPPLVYRAPAAEAPTDELGEDEWKKERRLKAEARKKAGAGKSWRDFIPGF